MKEVFANRDFTRVGYYKSILDAAGIPNFIRNQDVHTSEVTAPQFDPALVVEDEYYEQAMSLLRPVHSPPDVEEGIWTCPSCKAEVPANFETCWSCGTERPVNGA
jgi:hypothetical protein